MTHHVTVVMVTIVMVILEIKSTVFTYLLSNEECESFPKHLDLVLVPNKTKLRQRGAALG